MLVTFPKLLTTPAFTSGPVTKELTGGIISSLRLSISKVVEAAVVSAAKAVEIVILSPKII